MPKSDQKPVLVAAIAGAFGVKGEVRLKSFTDDPAACLAYAPFLDKDGKQILSIRSSRRIKNGFAVFANEITTREEAEAGKSTKLYAARERFVDLAEGDYYQTDLLGLMVKDADGKNLGQIKAVLNFGASDLLEVFNTPGVSKSWTIPFTKHHVPVVDIAGGKVVLHEAEAFISPDDTANEDEGTQS